MDDVKDKVKGFMKKVNNPFSSSSSGKFKGQGRVLGSSSSGPSNPVLARPTQVPETRRTPPVSNPKPQPQPQPQIPQTDSRADQRLKDEPIGQNVPNSDHRAANGFDPFGSLVTSGKRSQNGHTLQVIECPVCSQSFRTEEDVSEHIDSCVSDKVSIANVEESPTNGSNAKALNELADHVGAFLSGGVSQGSVEVVLRLLRNIIKEPNNDKFRRIRMNNPKISEAIGAVAGGVELLEYVGFRLQEEGGEMWAVMEEPSENEISIIRESILLLEPSKTEQEPCFSRKTEDLPSVVAATEVVAPAEPKKIDRQIRVFFSVAESIARKIDVPESFYNLSAEELRREVEMRKKKLADSQVLIPRSYKEKQAKTSRKRYKNALIRIQFPDEVVLQGVFYPWERTTALYEFVSSALKEPSLEFELLRPVVIKLQVIPRFPVAGGRTPTLDEEDLVPAALVKFKPIETDSIVFTGLRNELLEISEPLS